MSFTVIGFTDARTAVDSGLGAASYTAIPATIIIKVIRGSLAGMPFLGCG